MADGSWLSPESERLSPEAERLSPKCEHLSPECERLSPERGRLSPESERLSPKRERLSPKCASLSPKREPLSPKCEPLRALSAWGRAPYRGTETGPGRPEDQISLDKDLNLRVRRVLRGGDSWKGCSKLSSRLGMVASRTCGNG